MAGRIPRDFIDNLLSRIDIVDVIGERVPLKKSGSNYTACCPFHNEKTPSFTVSQTKQFYHCFGCQANGTAISFLMNYDQLHFIDAVEQLAESVGLEVPREGGHDAAQDKRKPLYEVMERCARYYSDTLRKSPEAIAYLKRRGLSGETAKTFGLGYAPPGWTHLQSATGASNDQLLSLGMQIRHEEGRIYDRFRERIMFPIRDRRGRIIGFGGRILDNGEPKYLNSPETTLFHKGEELYALYEARKAAVSEQRILIVEGYMDVIALWQHGVRNAVATLGTATTPSHIETLFRTVPELVFCFDGDRAGRDAAWRALRATLPALRDGRDAHFAFLSDGEDPDSLISGQGKAAFDAFIRSALPVTDFMIERLSEGLDLSGVGGKARLAKEAKPLIETMPEGIYRQLTIRQIETLIGARLDVAAAREETPPPAPAPHAPTGPATPAKPGTGTQRRRAEKSESLLLRRAATLVLQIPAVIANYDESRHAPVADTDGAALLLDLIKQVRGNPQISTAALLEHFRESPVFKGLSKLASAPLLPDNHEMDADAAAEEFINILRKLRLLAERNRTGPVPESHRRGLLGIGGRRLRPPEER
ncbi:DNA primase [Granulosicoccaceae sp. 1_MG-2023]|nr:DNA primase [Granulosicoccaceae sp. 1_MG-2023]